MSLKVLFIEPFFEGSHRAFCEGYKKHSAHRVTIAALPGRYWKWRMRGAAHYVAEKYPRPEEFDLILVTNMISIADLIALWGRPHPPILLYFHENQITYPLPKAKSLDYHYGLTDITNALVADTVVFNSIFHREQFFGELPRFTDRFPDFQPSRLVERIQPKTQILYPGCDFTELSGRPAEYSEFHQPKVILWNHRWEFDKVPEHFFGALEEMESKKLAFQVVVLGRNLQTVPTVFSRAKQQFEGKILQFGYADSRKEYFTWLERCDIAVSTAIQENFGMAVVEAVRAGCVPLLPRRLSYPELLPQEHHGRLLYRDTGELSSRLEELLSADSKRPWAKLPAKMERFSWENRIDEYDALCRRLVTGSP